MKTLVLSALALGAAAPAAAQDAPAGPLTLAQTIAAVVDHYPSIDAAQAAIDAARGRTLQANASRLPQVSAHGAYSYDSFRPYVAIDIPNVVNASIYESVNNAYATTVTATQLLTDFGRTDKLVAMARSGQVTAQDVLEETRHQLGYQAIESFYGVLLLRSSVTVAREEITSLDEALRIAERKFAAGSATRFDVLTTQVRLANAHNRLTDTLASLRKQENGLRQLLGWDMARPVELAGDFDADAPTLSAPEAVAAGLAHRPEMKVAVDREHTARLQLDAADRGNRPSLTAQLTGGLENGQLPSLYDHKGYVLAAVDLQVPIFTGRRVTGDRVAAKADVRSAQAGERELTSMIAMEVADAFADLAAARARLANADPQVDQAREALALAQSRYSHGVITNFELLDAQSALRGAQLSRLQARYDCVLARQAVARAAGVAPAP
jgi:outer membrane protein TolC